MTLLDIEEICGEFGSFDEQTAAYRPARATVYGCPIMQGQLHCLDGFLLTLLTEARKTEKVLWIRIVGNSRYCLMVLRSRTYDVPFEQGDDVQRFERQGYSVNYFNLRV